MPSYIALLRAVNVGGTGKLPMSDLKILCEQAGFTKVKTYIASGNVLFQSTLSEVKVKAILEEKLAAYAGKPVGVLVRTSSEMAAILAANPFPDRPGNRTVAIFLDSAPPSDALDRAVGIRDEEFYIFGREIYISYSDNMADSKLRIPAAKEGTARNLNTIAKLAELSVSF